jgi:hypothetical protein
MYFSPCEDEGFLINYPEVGRAVFEHTVAAGVFSAAI